MDRTHLDTFIMTRAQLEAYADLCSSRRAKPITPRAELIIDRIAEHCGITRSEAGELPLLAAVAVWREIREGWEPRQPVCCWCGDDIDATEEDSRLIFDGWECQDCRIKHDEDEAERNRPELEEEDYSYGR
jgi:hypothetical protein